MDKIAFDIGEKFFGTPSHFLTQLTDVGKLVSILLSNAIVIAGVILIFLIIAAGFNFVSGGGAPEKIEQSKNILTYGILGFIIVVMAFLIIRIIERMTGTNILG